MKNYRYIRGLHYFLLASFAPMTPAFAQAGQPDDGELTKEIIVTARLRTERLQDVPVAITVVSGDQLSRTATSSFQNLSVQIPQVMFTRAISGTGANVSIRGIGANTSGDDSIEQAVSFNLDGVSSARGRLITQALFDLNNVQVLKGPQALFFGKNSPGGVIVVQSNDPGDRLEGYVTGGYEFRAAEYRVEGAIGGPITDTLGVRLAILHSDMRKGYVRNIAGPVAAADSPIPFDKANGIDTPGRSYEWGPQSRQTAGRLTLVFKPVDEFSAKLKFTAADYKDNGDTSALVVTSCVPGASNSLGLDLGGILFTGAPAVVPDPFSTCSQSRNQSVGAFPAALAATIPEFGSGKSYVTTRSYLSSLELNYDAGPVQLTSVTGFYNGKTRSLANYDLSAFDVVPSLTTSNQTSWTEEFRAATHLDGNVNFTVGAFYSHDNKEMRVTGVLLRSLDPITQEATTYRVANSASGHSLSGFGEVIWKITPEIELDAGARYTTETKEATLRSVYVQAGLASLLGLALPQGQSVFARVKQDAVLPQATLSWKPSPNVTLFGGYRTGSKSGGVANPQLIPAAANSANQSFRQERAKGYEAGVKFSAFDRRLNGDLTFYDYRFEGLQVIAFNADTNALFVQNAGSATTSGVEGSANFRATDELNLRANFGYNRARYGSFKNVQCYGGQTVAQGCAGGASQDLTGRTLPRAPDFAAAVGFTWTAPVGHDLAIDVSADGRYSGSYYTSPVLSPYAFQKSYTMLDASVRLHRSDDAWELSLIGHNLTDKYYVTFTADTPLGVTPGSQYGLLGDPRTVTLQATYHF